MKLFNRFKKVLIIEDDKALRRAIAEKLRHEQYQVLEADNGQEGLADAMTKRPNLILLDLMLPRLDGMGVLRELRDEKNLWGKKVPVIIITNLGQTDERRKRADAFRVRAYIDKSQHPLEEIVKQVQAAL